MCVLLLAKIILQQIAMKYNLPEEIPCRAIDISQNRCWNQLTWFFYWVRSVVTDKTLDVRRPDTVPIVRGNKTAFVIDTAVPLTHNLPTPRQRKLRSMKTWPWKQKISVSLTTYLYTPWVISAYIWNIGLTKNILRVVQKAVLLQTCHTLGKLIVHAPWL